MSNYYTITHGDIGKPAITAFGHAWTVTDWIGRILPGDVGKRVYRVSNDDDLGQSYILQVENNEQRDARIAKGA